MKGIIYLEDGTYYKGTGFGYCGTTVGELVFNTAMTGYQKTLTDPSYRDQIITMTYPLIGNYGVNNVDFESEKIHALGLVCRDVCFQPSNWRSEKDIHTWLVEQKIPGVYNIDTRELTRRLRRTGTQKCVISTEEKTIQELAILCTSTEVPLDQMKHVSVESITTRPAETEEPKFQVAVLDFGVKENILKELEQRGCQLTLYPYGTKASTILEGNPDGIFLTNGPGDPEAATEAIQEVKELIARCEYGSAPIFGICMGHQILALASGGETYKMKYGHRGGNHGVFDKTTGRSYITSQNHGYAVKGDSALLHNLDITHLNLNDGTVEGMQHMRKPIFSVQFHPESNPGPNDTTYLFNRFISLMEGGRL